MSKSGKSGKIVAAFLAAIIIFSLGGFIAAMRGNNNKADTTTAVFQSSESDTEKIIEEATTGTTNTQPATDNPTDLTKATASTTVVITTAKDVTNTGYPYNYPGINPRITDTTSENWNLILVNSNYYLPESYNFNLAIAIEGYPAKLDARAAVYYTEMFKAAKKEGITLAPTSVNGGYRSNTTQKGLFEDKIKRYENAGDSRTVAVQKAAKINQPPGCSEHNAGLAMDIGFTDTSFANTKDFKWLEKNAADYGFILRYANDKQEITKIMYEPWHWRYVGVDAARAINSSGECLEEYLHKTN